MRRRVFAFTSLLSLLLCLTVVGLWLRVRLVDDVIVGDFGGLGQVNASTDGLLYRHWTRPSTRPWVLWEWRGFYYHTEEIIPFGENRTVGIVREVAAPYWSLVSLTAVVPLLWACLYMWPSRRRIKNVCSNCSYDLTGNTSGTCPECGTAVPQPSRPA